MFCRKSVRYGIAGAFLAASFASAYAQQPTRSASSPSGLSALDKDYLKAAAQSNLEVIEFAPTVQQQAHKSADKQFGRRMKSDHSKANATLKVLAGRVCASQGGK